MADLGFYVNKKDFDLVDVCSLVDPVIDCIAAENIPFKLHQTNVSSTHKDAIAFILANKTLIICTHGGERCLFHCLNSCDTLVDDNEDDKNNISVFRSKRIVAVACSTGRKLIHSAIDNGCEAYLGFTSMFRVLPQHYNNDDDIRLASLNLYREIISEVLVSAIKSNWLFSKIAIEMKILASSKNNLNIENRCI